MSFLEQLFFGNVDPQCRESLHPKAMRKAQQTLSSLEQTLMDQLPTPRGNSLCSIPMLGEP